MRLPRNRRRRVSSYPSSFKRWLGGSPRPKITSRTDRGSGAEAVLLSPVDSRHLGVGHRSIGVIVGWPASETRSAEPDHGARRALVRGRGTAHLALDAGAREAD